MKINWKVRLKNKTFWVALVPAVMILIQAIAALFGFTLDLGAIGDKILDIVEAVFIILAILGIVVDSTTPGISDSERALTYTKPGVSEEK